MKTRQGFVSNSSSSSFVILVEENAHAEALKELTDYQRDVINHFAEKKNVFGRKVFVLGELNDMSGYSSLIEEDWQPDGWDEKIEKAEEEDIDVEEEFSPAEAIFAYENAVEKQPASTWFKWDGSIG